MVTVQHCLQEMWAGPLRILMLHSEVIRTEEEQGVQNETQDITVGERLVMCQQRLELEV